MQALILAAGRGMRLRQFTKNKTKGMVEIDGKTLLMRACEALHSAGITKLVLVAGFAGEQLVEYANEHITFMDIEFVFNHEYASTNNMYSLYLARNHLLKDDTIILESDLIFDKEIIEKLVAAEGAGVAVVDKYEHWMDGTVVLLDERSNIMDLIDKSQFRFEDVNKYYKTVNIYKFSKEFSGHYFVPFLGTYLQVYGNQQYYEVTLKAISNTQKSQVKALILDGEKWFEIDNAHDKDIAETMFANRGKILESYEGHFGGYWRFPYVKDFCYLVNPYFPTDSFMEKIKFIFNDLVTQYPAGISTLQAGVSRMFDVPEKNILVGNGAAELINLLGILLRGKILLPIPAFNEYLRCFNNCEFNYIETEKNGFELRKNEIISALDGNDFLVLINPDNPSGAFIEKQDMLDILDECEKRGIRCIVDESFIDFADRHCRYTLLTKNILSKYKRLVVIKSISKSYGVPGLRLGVLASMDNDLIRNLRKRLPVWNINSFAEYFVAIFPNYTHEFIAACDALTKDRSNFIQGLRNTGFLKPFPSQANYVLCEVSKTSSFELASRLIDDHNILVKDFIGKSGITAGKYIRFAVKSKEDNEYLIEILNKIANEL